MGVCTCRLDGTFLEVFLENGPRQGRAMRFEEARALDGGPPIRHEVAGKRIRPKRGTA